MSLSGPFKTTEALRRTFSISLREARVLLPMVLVVLLPEILLSGGWALWIWSRPDAMDQQWIYSLLATPVSLVTRQLAIAAVIPLVFASLRGARTSAREAVRAGLSRLLPVVGLALLVGIAVAVGTMLCLVPGAILFTATFVATPALMVEGTGVTDSWTRSFDLTRGYRWEVFGVVFVLVGIAFIIASSGAAMLPGLLADPERFMPRYIAINTAIGIVASLIGTVLSSVGATVVYHDLRLAKEGLDEEELLEVFQ